MARVRSPNYPAISLPDAIERARKVYLKEHTHKAAPEVVAKAMGYGGLNGGSLSAISALKKYGLLEEVGKELKISKDGLSILVDPKDSAVRKRAIRQAAFLPTLFADLHKEYGETLPSDENLRAFLQKRGFSPSAVDVPIRAYRETIALVTSEGAGYDLEPNQPDADVMVEEIANQPSGATTQQPARPSSGFKGTVPPAQLIEAGSYPVAKNTMVRLLATRPLTEDAVKALIKHLQMGVDIGLYPSADDEAQ